jgi:hypothetical protein
MIKPEQIPDEVTAILKAAGDTGEPWNVNDVIAAMLNAWPEAHYRPAMRMRKLSETWTTPSQIILPLKEPRT